MLASRVEGKGERGRIATCMVSAAGLNPSEHSFYKKHLSLIVVLLLAALLRFGLLAHTVFHRFDPIAGADERQYHWLAVNIVQHREFSVPFYNYDEFRKVGFPQYLTVGFLRTPGFPVFLAAVYSAVGVRPYAAVTLIAILSCILCGLTYIFASRLFGHRTGVVAALIMAVSPDAILSSCSLLADTPHAVLILLAILSLNSSLNGAPQKAALSGLILGIAALFKPVSLYLPIVLSGVLAFTKTRVRIWLAVTAAALIVVMPWCLRNYFATGKWFFSTIGIYNLVFYNLAFAKAEAIKSNVDTVRLDYLRKLVAESGPDSIVRREVPLYWLILLKNQLVGGGFLFWMAADRLQWSYFLKGKFIHSGAHDRLWDTGAVAAVARILNSPGGVAAVFQALFNALYSVLGLTGMVNALRHSNTRVMALLCLSICAYYALTAGPVGFARYRLPTDPFLATFAAGVLCRWFGNRLEKRKAAETARCSEARQTVV
jgi:asparagine N-glycosylation enzyme membrane subunit Stt3